MPLLAVALTALLVTAGSTPPVVPDKAPAQAASVAGEKTQDPNAKDADSTPPQTPEEKSAQAANRSYMLSLARALRNSGSPRDRAMATEAWWTTDVWDGREPTSAERAQRGAILRAAAEAAPDDVLVQWQWAEASPEDSGCDAGKPCPHRLDAVARIQPDNGSAWVPVFNAAWQAKNIPAEESALANMARATYFDEQIGTSLKAWMDVFHRYPVSRSVFVPGSPGEQFDEQAIEFTESMAFSTSPPAWQGPVDACHHDRHPDASPQRFRDCAQIGRTMLANSTSWLSQAIGRALLHVSGEATAEDIANARVVAWQHEHWPMLEESSPGHELGDIKATAADWLDTGDEIQVT